MTAKSLDPAAAPSSKKTSSGKASPPTPSRKTKRKAPADSLSREDWMNAALEAIAENGLRAVAVEPLAKRLEVTKGSFYWHFKNRDALLLATLEYWEERWTDRGHERLYQIEDPRQRLRELFAVVLRRFDRAAVNISLHDSASNEAVREVVSRVTQKRLDFLIQTYGEMGLATDDAPLWAFRAYSSYIGMHELLRIYREPLGTDLDRVVDHLIESIIPPE